jgi:hypothetical protein
MCRHGARNPIRSTQAPPVGDVADLTRQPVSQPVWRVNERRHRIDVLLETDPLKKRSLWHSLSNQSEGSGDQWKQILKITSGRCARNVISGRLSMTDEWRGRCRENWHGGFGEGSGETCCVPREPELSANATRSAPTLHKCESYRPRVVKRSDARQQCALVRR